nr:MAG TPA: hypothetical protein [Caudoviricetes sp.]
MKKSQGLRQQKRLLHQMLMLSFQKRLTLLPLMIMFLQQHLMSRLTH